LASISGPITLVSNDNRTRVPIEIGELAEGPRRRRRHDVIDLADPLTQRRD
jgi:hypothetical protein